MLGLPLAGPITLRDGMLVQYFKRAPFDFHNRGTRYAVLLGLLRRAGLGGQAAR